MKRRKEAGDGPFLNERIRLKEDLRRFDSRDIKEPRTSGRRYEQCRRFLAPDLAAAALLERHGRAQHRCQEVPTLGDPTLLLLRLLLLLLLLNWSRNTKTLLVVPDGST